MGTREHLIEVTSALLARQGIAGTSTRAICEAAGVGAPTLYHYFGDKDGLLAAVVTVAFERFLTEKRAALHGADPLENLRQGWDAYVSFGAHYPAYYVALASLPASLAQSPAADEASALLREHLVALHDAGQLRVDVDRAVQMIWSALHGLVSLRIARPDLAWQEDVSSRMREAIIGAVVAPTP